MSLKFLNIKDNKRRINCKRVELNQKINNFLSDNIFVSEKKRRYFLFKLDRVAFNSSFVQIKNRCVITASARSCYSFFKLSRIQLKQRVLGGFIFGLKKSSW